MTGRYEIRPSGVFPHLYMVVDLETGIVARDRGRTLTRLIGTDAEIVRDRLNLKAARRKVCRSCRHKTPALEIVDGRCRTCAA